jgi:K319-like protein
VLCIVCLSIPILGVSPTAQLLLTPSPIARGETVTVGILLDNAAGSPLENTTLYVPLPVGIDQWNSEVRINGGTWMAYPANGLIALPSIPPWDQMAVDIQVPIESTSPATLTVVAQLLDATGILAQISGWVNVLPSVDAGPDLIVDIGVPIPLVDPTASDGGGLIVGYSWTDHGSGGSFDDAIALRPTYTPPAASGVFELRLTATDSDGGESSDSLRVRVNATPEVNIGGDLDAEEGVSLSIGQATVSDSDGWIADVVWSDGDAGGAFLPSNGVVDPVYLVPEIEGCDDALIELTLEVADEWGATDSDTLTLHVANVNSLPTLLVPEDLEIGPNRQVDLSAIASDEDGWIESQEWRQLDGMDVELHVGSQQQHSWFDAPDVDAFTQLTFRFQVIDNCGASVWDDVIVTVVPEVIIDDTPIDDTPIDDTPIDDTPIDDTPIDDDPTIIDGSLSVSIDVFDERGLPLTSFDSPRVGDAITVRVSVANTGQSMLHDLSATLNNGSTLGLLPDQLQSWGSAVGTFEWLVSSSELAGGLEIIAIATGEDEFGTSFAATDAFQFLTAMTDDTEWLRLDKETSVTEASVDEIIVYEYRITNRGVSDLIGLRLYDDELGWIELPTTTLHANATVEVHVSYAVRESDFPGPLVNGAVATGFTSQGDRVEAVARASVDLLDMGGGGGSRSESQGKVVISEIAWAGSPTNSTEEWIELANIGFDAVDLSGWHLAWYDKEGSVPQISEWHSIELSGVIQPMTAEAQSARSVDFVQRENGVWSILDPRWPSQGVLDGFFLVERASDNAVSNIPAGIVYGDAENPYFDLPDSGAVLFLMNETGKIVDSANAQYADRTGWPAGNPFTCSTMERINLNQGDFDGNWQTTSGVLTYGVDAFGRGLKATAGRPNSLAMDVLLQIASISVNPEAAAGILSVPIPDTSASDRVSIQMTALAGSLAVGGGGAVNTPDLTTLRTSEGLTIEVDLENALSGAYFVWITFKNGQAMVLPVQK